MVREQLRLDQDRDCEPLGKQGLRGVLFKITLTCYGYTVVAKGTVSVFIPDLLHEGHMYQLLENIQGKMILVYLGNINLIKKYYLDWVEIEHMLLMSWAGEMADEANIANLNEEIKRSLQDMLREGVIHGDVRESNMLWNAEQQRVMLIDFKRSTPLSKVKNKVIEELSGQKRK